MEVTWTRYDDSRCAETRVDRVAFVAAALASSPAMTRRGLETLTTASGTIRPAQELHQNHFLLVDTQGLILALASMSARAWACPTS